MRKVRDNLTAAQRSELVSADVVSHEQPESPGRWLRRLLAVVLTLGACSACSVPSHAPAVLSGVAAPCPNPFWGGVPRSRIPVRVVLTKSARIVASETLKGRHIYRFVVSPGRCVVRSDAPGERAVGVTLRFDETANVGIPVPGCAAIQ